MLVVKLIVKKFRGIKSAVLIFPRHTVLLGDNNIGKSTILEALDLVLGPDRVNRQEIIDEHDFYNGEYKNDNEIYLEAVIIDLSPEQKRHFSDFIEWWSQDKQELIDKLEDVEHESAVAALRVCFKGNYCIEEDDFTGATYFAKSLIENQSPQVFRKKDKQKCGFLYLRSIRTGSRALSLEHGSLLDTILRIKELRPQMWEKTIEELRKYNVENSSEFGITGILENIEKSIKKYVPREWGGLPHLKISNLTRAHLRKIITAFISTGNDSNCLPFNRQSTGSINILVLAMLSMIAEEKHNVIFAMEEPETAIPPYTQKRIVHEC